MQSFCVTLSPLSAFATPLKGDTLFGQLCWAIRNRLGEDVLNECLEGYASGRPFSVVSDVFPQGYLPLPKLPNSFYQLPDNTDRKAVKKLSWMPETALQKPLTEWLCHSVNSSAIAAEISEKLRGSEGTASARFNLHSLSEEHPKSHNTINRQTNTTGEGGFAPYSVEQEWFIPGLRWTLYILLDTERLSREDCVRWLEYTGSFGSGMDASIVMGKY